MTFARHVVTPLPVSFFLYFRNILWKSLRTNIKMAKPTGIAAILDKFLNEHFLNPFSIILNWILGF